MILGEKMPSKDDPKYRETYERDVEAGRKFAKRTRLDRLVGHVQKFADRHSGLFLGIVLAILSSFRNQIVPDDMVVFGEVGLSGEIRSVAMAQSRVREAAKLGFHQCILPGACMKGLRAPDGIRLLPVSGIGELIRYLENS